MNGYLLLSFVVLFIPFVFSAVKPDTPYYFKSCVFDKKTKATTDGYLTLMWRTKELVEELGKKLRDDHQNCEPELSSLGLGQRKECLSYEVPYFDLYYMEQLMALTELGYFQSEIFPGKDSFEKNKVKLDPSSTDPILLCLIIMSEDIRKKEQQALRQKSGFWREGEQISVESASRQNNRYTEIYYGQDVPLLGFTKKQHCEELLKCPHEENYDGYIVVDNLKLNIITDVVVVYDSLKRLNFPVFFLNNCRLRGYIPPENRSHTIDKQEVIGKLGFIGCIDRGFLSAVSRKLWQFQFECALQEGGIEAFPFVCFYGDDSN